MTVSDAQAVELLTEMLRLESLCGKEDRLAAFLLRWMREEGFEAARDAVGNVIGSVGGDASSAGEPGSRSVVILGHMDTVPGAIPVEVRDGALHGRGAVDAKGPLATALVAAARARPALRVTVIGAVQEEGPSVGAHHLVRRPAPDFLIIAEPSGWDSIVLGYKGTLRFTVRLSQACSHTAGPEPTAPERAVAFWNQLVAWCDRQSASDGGKDTFTHLTPTLIEMSSRSDGLYETAAMHVGLRLPPGILPDEVREGVAALLPDGTFDFGTGEPAVRGGKSTPLVASFLRSIRTERGAPRFKLKTGTSDMNVVGHVWRCPMVAYGPGDSRLDHTPEEHVRVDEYLCAIRILTRVLGDL